MKNNVLKYKDFYGAVEYSSVKDCFCGKITGITETVNFEGDSVSLLKKAFYEAVDKYIIECEKKGKDKKKSYKGSFNVRISPELHQDAATAAVQKNISLNSFVEKAIHREVYEKIKKIESKKEKIIMLYTYIKQNYKFTDEDKKEALKIFEQIIIIAHKVRKNGLLSIDDEISTFENPFLRKAMQFAVDSTPPEEIAELLDRYIILGDYTSKEMLELLLIKEGTISIVNGENPFFISEKLATFFGINFENETKEVYQNFINAEINKFYQNIKAGHKFFPQEANLLETKFKNLSDKDIQILSRNIEVDDIILAINGSSAEVADKIFRNMSKRNSDTIAEIIVFNRNWKKYNDLESIIAAQKRILAKIDELKSE